MSGDGSFVDVSESNLHPTPSSMYQNINETIDYTRAYADEMRTSLSASIEELGNILENYNPDIADIDTTVPDVEKPVFPARPDFGDLGLDDNWPTDFPVDPTFMDYGDIDFEFVAPDPPAEIDGNFNWTGREYTSDMWFALFSKVHNDILNGGTGLSDEVHAAIVAREREARRVNQEREYRRALDAVGARGFNLPAGQIAAIQAETMREMMARDQDALNNLLIKDFDMATENTRFAITTGAELEKMLRTAFDAAEQRGFEAAKAAKDYLIAVYSENVKLYLAKWEGIKTMMEALKAKIDGIARYNDGLAKVFLVRAEVLNTRVKAIAEKNLALIEARKGEVDVYTAEVEAVSKEYASLVEEVKTKMEGVRLQVTSAIEESKLQLEAYTSKANLSERVSEAIANISAQAIASALGAINTSMSHSYSGSESKSEGWNHSDSISETHNFEEG